MSTTEEAVVININTRTKGALKPTWSKRECETNNNGCLGMKGA